MNKVLYTTINSVDKKQSYDYELIAQAHHEAGHTICALYNLMKITSVVVMNNRENGDGKTEYLFTDPDLLLNENIIQLQLEFELQVSYAGLLAEKIYYKDICGSDKFPMHLKKGSSGDIKEASNLINKYKIAPAGNARTQLKKQVQKDTNLILQEHWSDVKLVAHSLYRKKRLNFDDLKFILTRKSEFSDFWKERFKHIKSINDKNISEDDLESLFKKIKLL